MDAMPWVTISHTKDNYSTFRSYDAAFDDLCIDHQSTPMIISFIGKHEKSNILRQLIACPDQYPLLPHGQVYIWPHEVTRDSSEPLLFLDSELQSYNSTHWKEPIRYDSPELSQNISWLEFGDQNRIVALFNANILTPLSSVMCYFLEDFGSLKDIAEHLAEQMDVSDIFDMATMVHPEVLVISQEPRDEFEMDTERKLAEYIKHARQRRASPNAPPNDANYGKISIFYLEWSNRASRAEILLQKIKDLKQDIMSVKRSKKLVFRYNHLRAFARLLLQKFSTEPLGRFSFIAASRPEGFSSAEFETHLQELLDILPSEAWLWHLVAPLVASCLVYANYPPGSHGAYSKIQFVYYTKLITIFFSV